MCNSRWHPFFSPPAYANSSLQGALDPNAHTGTPIQRWISCGSCWTSVSTWTPRPAAMSSPKHPKDFTVDEVCMWLVAIGLGDIAPMFRSAAVDGGLLTDLAEEDLKEVGCSGLQAKKILRCLDVSKDMASAGGSNDIRLQQLQAENDRLRAQIQQLTAALNQQKGQSGGQYASTAPAYVSNPPPPQQHQAYSTAPPAQNHHHQKPMGHPVVAGAAGGALTGAVKGAVAGAILGDPAKGAKVGAAVGATGGAMGGLGARRRARMSRGW